MDTSIVWLVCVNDGSVCLDVPLVYMYKCAYFNNNDHSNNVRYL